MLLCNRNSKHFSGSNLHIPDTPATYLFSIGGRLQKIGTADNLWADINSLPIPDKALLHWFDADQKLEAYLKARIDLKRGQKIYELIDAEIPYLIIRYYRNRIVMETRDLDKCSKLQLQRKKLACLHYQSKINSFSFLPESRSEKSRWGKIQGEIEQLTALTFALNKTNEKK